MEDVAWDHCLCLVAWMFPPCPQRKCLLVRVYICIYMGLGARCDQKNLFLRRPIANMVLGRYMSLYIGGSCGLTIQQTCNRIGRAESVP